MALDLDTYPGQQPRLYHRGRSRGTAGKPGPGLDRPWPVAHASRTSEALTLALLRANGPLRSERARIVIGRTSASRT